MKKRIIAYASAVLILIVIVVAVYFRFFYYDSPKKNLKTALDSMMIQDGETAERYLDYKSFHALGGDDALCTTLLRDFAYEVKGVEKLDKRNAVADIQVSNRDIETLYGNFVVEAYQFVISDAYKPEGQRMTEDELKQQISTMLETALEDNEVHLRTREIQVEMTREDKTWFLNFDEQDYDDIYGGYLTARKHAETLLGDMSTQALVNVEEAYMSNIDDADHVLRNAVHFIVDDLWNGNLCNIVSCINAGTDHMGNDYDLEEGMKILDGLMTEKVTYDVYINNLSEIEHGEVKTAWKNLSDVLRQLVDEIKAADPQPTDYDYMPDTSKFEEVMNEFVDLIYTEKE